MKYTFRIPCRTKSQHFYNITTNSANLFISQYEWPIFIHAINSQTRVQGGGPWGLPPLEIEKQKKKKKKKKKVIRANFKGISPILGYFFSRKYHFFSYFLSWAPP